MPGFKSVFVFEHFSVRADRMACDLRISDDRFASLDAPAVAQSSLAARLVERFPSLPDHACVNDSGPTFSSCMAHASMPHLLEHLVIAFQAEAELAAMPKTGPDPAVRPPAPFALPPFVYVGKTCWTDRARLAARVEVNYRDDITAFRAFRDAASLIDSIVLG